MVKALFPIVLLLCSASSSWVAADNSQRLDDVRQEIKNLNESLSEKKSDKASLYKQLKQHSKQVSTLNRQLRESAQKIAAQKASLRSLHENLGIKQQEQEAQLDALYAQIRSAYIHAQPNYLEVLLNQKNIATFSRASTYYQYFHQARQQQLTSINDTLLQLNNEQQQLLAAQKQLENFYSQQQTQQQQLTAETEKRKNTLMRLEAAISSDDARLTALKSEEQSLQSLLEKLAKRSTESLSPSLPTTATVKPSGPFSRLTGKLPWPVSGKLLANYGSSRNLGDLRWQGIVIASRTGNEVHASAAGKVVFADWLRGFGLLIIIDHGEQYMTLYGNNESLLRDVGDQVNAGEVIAQSGEQGIRGLAGLYFEVRHKGNPKNPLKWLQKQS